MSTSGTTIPAQAAGLRTLPLACAILRLGAAFCFIGHGAFGIITKEAWLPYFAVAGIPAAWAWRLMPWIGAIDIAAGLAVLLAPHRWALLYMVTWASLTALLRPLAGEPVFEAIERAGNYGVPLAFLLLSSRPRDAHALARVRTVLTWTVCLLLLGHGALGAISDKQLLTGHYASIGLPPLSTALVGWLEIGLAAVVVFRPSVGVLLHVTAWKLATESLFIVAGFPVWEFVERAGSYAAPLALAVLLMPERGPADPFPTESARSAGQASSSSAAG